MPNNTPSRKILPVILITLVILAGSFFLYTKYGYNRGTDNQTADAMRIFSETYHEAQALQNLGDYSGAVNVFTDLLKNAPDKASEGKIKIFIAANLFLRNQGDDQVRGIQAYKEVFNDPAMPTSIRAKVLTDLAGVVRSKDSSFYTTYFSEQPFGDFLPASGMESARMSTVYLKMLQLSDTTNPNSYAEYLIAGNYYAPRLVNNVLVDTTPEEAAKTMQEYVRKADLLAPTDESSYKPQIMIERYFYRALALGASNRVLNNVSLTTRENAYKLALEKGAPYENSKDYPAIAVVMKARFYYANLLMEFSGQERYPDIVTLLKPFGKAASGSDPAFKATRSQYSNLSAAPDTDFTKTRAIALANVSPEMRDFLFSLGVNPSR